MPTPTMAITPMQLVDIGANLTHESFRQDFEAVLSRARAAGVEQMLVTGASLDGSRDALALAQRHRGVLFATAGVHPHHAGEVDAGAEDVLRTLLKDPCVRAAGEMGLDYFRDFAPRAAQRTAFERQLALAAELRMPLFLHQREAHADFLPLLRSVRDAVPAAVVHCFTDGRKALHDYLDLDCHIGITGWLCDERRGTHLRELVRSIPRGRLLIETDAPYLLPRSLRPRPAHRRNEPMYLMEVLRELARARGEDPVDLAAATSQNARAVFGLPQPSL